MIIMPFDVWSSIAFPVLLGQTDERGSTDIIFNSDKGLMFSDPVIILPFSYFNRFRYAVFHCSTCVLFITDDDDDDDDDDIPISQLRK